MTIRGSDVLTALYDNCAGLIECRAFPSGDRIFCEPPGIEAVKPFSRAIALDRKSVV